MLILPLAKFPLAAEAAVGTGKLSFPQISRLHRKWKVRLQDHGDVAHLIMFGQFAFCFIVEHDSSLKAALPGVLPIAARSQVIFGDDCFEKMNCRFWDELVGDRKWKGHIVCEWFLGHLRLWQENSLGGSIYPQSIPLIPRVVGGGMGMKPIPADIERGGGQDYGRSTERKTIQAGEHANSTSWDSHQGPSCCAHPSSGCRYCEDGGTWEGETKNLSCIYLFSLPPFLSSVQQTLWHRFPSFVLHLTDEMMENWASPGAASLPKLRQCDFLLWV